MFAVNGNNWFKLNALIVCLILNPSLFLILTICLLGKFDITSTLLFLIWLNFDYAPLIN